MQYTCTYCGKALVPGVDHNCTEKPAKMVKISMPESTYNSLLKLGLLDSKERSYNEGSSNYSEHFIQPWSIWLDYPELTSWDHDIIKRVLRTKKGENSITDYKKIIHICKERIRQLKLERKNSK